MHRTQARVAGRDQTGREEHREQGQERRGWEWAVIIQTSESPSYKTQSPWCGGGPSPLLLHGAHLGCRSVWAGCTPKDGSS